MTKVKTNVEEEAPPCTFLRVASADYAASIRAQTESARSELQTRIHSLRPGLCNGAWRFFLLVFTWLVWTIAAPLVLLLYARDHPSMSHVDVLIGMGWALVGTGVGYVLCCVFPILLGGCIPRPPVNDGPFLRECIELPPLDLATSKHHLPGRHSSVLEEVGFGNALSQENDGLPGAISPGATPNTIDKGSDPTPTTPSTPATPIFGAAARDVSLLHPQLSGDHLVCIRRRCVWILFNPTGQHGPSSRHKAFECRRLLTERGACVHVKQTEYAGHAADLGRDPMLLPLERSRGTSATVAPDDATTVPSSSSSSVPSLSTLQSSVAAVVIIGGDGLFSEFVNGYMHRISSLNIPPSKRTPLALVAAGSGNSLARDLYSSNLSLQTAIDAIRGGQVKFIDVNEIQDEVGARLYSTNVISSGLVGDTAVVAEEFRVFGDRRYDILALWNVMRGVVARARFILRGIGGNYNRRKGVLLVDEQRQEEVEKDGPPGFTRKPSLGTALQPIAVAAAGTSKNRLRNSRASTSPHHAFTQQLGGGSSTQTTAFFNATQHFGKGHRACPHAKLDDGLMDVLIAEGGLSRSALLKVFKQLPRGAHMDNAGVNYFQVRQIDMDIQAEETGQSHGDERSNTSQQQQPQQRYRPTTDGDGFNSNGDDVDVELGSMASSSPQPTAVAAGGLGEVLTVGPSTTQRRNIRPNVINVDGENVVVCGRISVRCRVREIPIFVPPDA